MKAIAGEAVDRIFDKMNDLHHALAILRHLRDDLVDVGNDEPFRADFRDALIGAIDFTSRMAGETVTQMEQEAGLTS